MAGNRAKDTAEYTTLARAIGALETDPVFQNPDHLAGRFLGWKFSLLTWLCRSAAVRTRVRLAYERKLPGAARYTLARTRHVDALLEAELRAGARQVVILGAGYDSRALRFAELLGDARVIEVDHPDTSARKTALLGRAPGGLPAHVTYVAADLSKEPLAEVLGKHGFDGALRTFVIWEGVTMYLPEASVAAVLAFFRDHSPAGSSIVFDYVFRSILDGTCDGLGAPEIRRYVAALGEPFLFGIDEARAGDVLAGHGYDLASHFLPARLEATYLSDATGQPRGRVSGFMAILHGRVRPRPPS